jgi:hypothetical protein
MVLCTYICIYVDTYTNWFALGLKSFLKVCSRYKVIFKPSANIQEKLRTYYLLEKQQYSKKDRHIPEEEQEQGQDDDYLPEEEQGQGQDDDHLPEDEQEEGQVMTSYLDRSKNKSRMTTSYAKKSRNMGRTMTIHLTRNWKVTG